MFEPTDNPAADVQPEQPGSLADFLKDYGAGTTDPATPPEPAVPELLLGKFKSQEELAKAYQEAEKKISAQGQERATYEQQLAAERAEKKRFEQMARDFYQRQFDQPTAEQLAEQKKEWQDKYYEDPQGAIQELLEKERRAIFEQYVQPLHSQVQQSEAQRQFERHYTRLSSQHPDFEALAPEIEKVFAERPHLSLLPDSLEVAYNLVKAGQADPSSLLQNQDIRAKLKTDEDFKQEIIKEYLQGIQSGKPPAVIGQMGESPAALPTEIRTTADAKKASLAFLERFKGGA